MSLEKGGLAAAAAAEKDQGFTREEFPGNAQKRSGAVRNIVYVVCTHREIRMATFRNALRVSHSFRLTASRHRGNIVLHSSLPAPNFGASFARKRHPNEGENAMGALGNSCPHPARPSHPPGRSTRSEPTKCFAIVREEAMYDRPIPERHRIIFYVGHVEAFDWNLLAQRAFGLRSFQRIVRQAICVWH